MCWQKNRRDNVKFQQLVACGNSKKQKRPAIAGRFAINNKRILFDHANLRRVHSSSSFLFDVLHSVTLVKGSTGKSGHVYEDVSSSFVVGNESVTL